MMDSEATIRELNRKLTSEISARERMESEWKGTSEKKGLVESEHVAVLGLKVQLEAQIAVLERDLKGKLEVRMYFSTHFLFCDGPVTL